MHVTNTGAADGLSISYAEPGPLTAIAAPELERLGPDYRGVTRALRGIAVHELNADRYPVQLPTDREEVVQLRPAAALVDRIRSLDTLPLDQPRPVERRLVTFCRPLAVLAVSFMRAAGVPARARCGFAAPEGDENRFFDHWWIECRRDDQQRWATVDTGRDPDVQDLDFDPDDIPPGRCISGAEAWRLCRTGAVDPEMFGVDVHWGAWFVRGNVIRDLAALHKIEMLPWDFWGPMDTSTPLAVHPVDQLIDEIAEAEARADWLQLHRIYTENMSLHPPETMVAQTVGSYPDLRALRTGP